MKLKTLLKNRTVKNAGWIIGGRVVNKVLAFFVGILTARYLGPGNYGLINYAAAYTTFFASVCTLGIDSVIIKNFSDHPDETGTALGTTILLRATSSVLSALMIIGIAMIVDRDEPVTILVVALSTLGLVFQAFDSIKQWFQSRLQSKYAAIATLIAYVAASAYKVILLIQGRSVALFALATAVDHLVVAICLYIAYKKQRGPSFVWSKQKAKELLSVSGSYIIAGLMVSIYASTDKLMLKQMLDETTVGFYSTAVSISTTWAFVIQAVIDSVYPSVIHAYKTNQALFEKRNRQMYALVIYIAGFVSLIICVLAKPIMTILYGAAYIPAAAPLKVVVWYTAFSYLGVARNAWMVCENKQHYLKYLYSGAALINVILNVLLIPSFGATGAAAASLITQISTTVLLPILIKPLRGNVKMMLEAVLLKDVF